VPSPKPLKNVSSDASKANKGTIRNSTSKKVYSFDSLSFFFNPSLNQALQSITFCINCWVEES
jgi:hypothetical protein